MYDRRKGSDRDNCMILGCWGAAAILGLLALIGKFIIEYFREKPHEIVGAIIITFILVTIMYYSAKYK